MCFNSFNFLCVWLSIPWMLRCYFGFQYSLRRFHAFGDLITCGMRMDGGQRIETINVAWFLEKEKYFFFSCGNANSQNVSMLSVPLILIFNLYVLFFAKTNNFDYLLTLHLFKFNIQMLKQTWSWTLGSKMLDFFVNIYNADVTFRFIIRIIPCKN